MKLGAMLKRLSVGGGEADNVYLGTANRLSDLHRTRPQAPATSHPPSEPRSLLHPAAGTDTTYIRQRTPTTNVNVDDAKRRAHEQGGTSRV